jgi:flagellar hook-associated protein 3 FlgL
MRISTAGFHRIPGDAILKLQSSLSKTQNELATGSRIQSPADDPIGAVHLLELNRSLAESEQFGRNADAAMARLSTEEQALADSGSILQRVRELVVQANSGAVENLGREAIAVELRNRVAELMDVANRRDGKSEYLFSGYATTQQPFVRSGGVATYLGDQGSRVQQVGTTQRVADGDSGFEVFFNVQQGNGTFVTDVAAANTGTGSIDTGRVINAALFTPETYTITFVAPDSYQITNSVPTTVVPAAPANFVAGSAISFNGVQVTVTGTPAIGDTFTVSTSQKEDIFTSIDKAITAISTGTGGAAQRAQFATKIATALEQLDRAEDNLQIVRAGVGARLSVLDDAQATRENLSVELESAISKLRDVDYAEAITRLNRESLGLQAAQQSYAKLAQLSLFNYL